MEIVQPIIVENQKSYFSQKNIKTCILDSKYTEQNGHEMLILWIDLQGFCCSRLHSTKSHNLRTVFLLFINTWGINDLTFDYYWKQLQRWLLLLEQVITLVVEKNYNLNEQRLRGLLEN